jgi:hypothetical protein
MVECGTPPSDSRRTSLPEDCCRAIPFAIPAAYMALTAPGGVLTGCIPAGPSRGSMLWPGYGLYSVSWLW